MRDVTGLRRRGEASGLQNPLARRIEDEVDERLSEIRLVAGRDAGDRVDVDGVRGLGN